MNINKKKVLNEALQKKKKKISVVDMEVNSEAFLLKYITNDDKYIELKAPKKP